MNDDKPRVFAIDSDTGRAHDIIRRLPADPEREVHVIQTSRSTMASEIRPMTLMTVAAMLGPMMIGRTPPHLLEGARRPECRRHGTHNSRSTKRTT